MQVYHRLHVSASLVLGFFIASSAQQEGQAGVYWVFPKADERLTYHHNDVINVTWTSSFPTPYLVTFCRGTKGVDQVKSSSVSGYNASELVELDFTHADADCWFDLKPDLSGGKGSNSEGFAYISETGDEATIGLLSASTAAPSPTTTISTTASISSSATTSVTTTLAAGGGDTRSSATRTNLLATTTATSSIAAAETSATGAENNTSGGLSVGAQAGIGVGVGIAGVFIGAGAILLFLRRRRRGNATDEKSHLTLAPMSPNSNNSAATTSYFQTSQHEGGPATYGYSSNMEPAPVADGPKYLFPQSFPPPRSERHEMGYTPAPQEMDSTVYQAQELPTSRYT